LRGFSRVAASGRRDVATAVERRAAHTAGFRCVRPVLPVALVLFQASLRDAVELLGGIPASELAGYYRCSPFDSSLRSSAQGRLYGSRREVHTTRLSLCTGAGAEHHRDWETVRGRTTDNAHINCANPTPTIHHGRRSRRDRPIIARRFNAGSATQKIEPRAGGTPENASAHNFRCPSGTRVRSWRIRPRH